MTVRYRSVFLYKVCYPKVCLVVLVDCHQTYSECRLGSTPASQIVACLEIHRLAACGQKQTLNVELTGELKRVRVVSFVSLLVRSSVVS